MTTLREAAQQALEAWEQINKYGFVLADYEGPMEQAIAALRAALEQPEQEPVAYLYHDAQSAHDANPMLHSTLLVMATERRPECRNETPLFTHPPRREWRGLKEWEINDGLDPLPTEDVCSWSFRKGVYFAEAALRSKNYE